MSAPTLSAPRSTASTSELRVRLTTPGARPPLRAESGAAGYDLYAVGQQHGRMIDTGVAFEIPEGWVGIIKDRSSVAFAERGYTVAGVIDSSYRGTVRVLFDREVSVEDGERIAQLVIVPHFSGQVTVVDELTETERGAGRFGSTGRGVPVDTGQSK